MILSPWTVSALFLAAVGAVLALCLLTSGVRGLAEKDREKAADRDHLLLLLVVILGLVRAVAWPHLYLLFESYVPALAPQGVMCAYGVTRVQPELVAALQWAKPVTLALLAAWWTLALVDRRAEPPPFIRVRQLAIVPLALAACAECGLEIAYLFSEKLDTAVTCCTQAFDMQRAERSGFADPFALAGFASPAATFAAWCVAQGLAAALGWKAAGGLQQRGGAVIRWLVALLAVASLLLARAAWLDFVAPRVLKLPFHHCIDEVLTRAPAMGFAAMLLIGGNVALLGRAALWQSRERAPGAILDFDRRLANGSALALFTALWVVAIHVG